MAERYTLFVPLRIFKIHMKIKTRSRRPFLDLNVFLKVSNRISS